MFGTRSVSTLHRGEGCEGDDQPEVDEHVRPSRRRGTANAVTASHAHDVLTAPVAASSAANTVITESPYLAQHRAR